MQNLIERFKIVLSPSPSSAGELEEEAHGFETNQNNKTPLRGESKQIGGQDIA